MSDKSHSSNSAEPTLQKKRSKKALIISLVIVAILLIGGGVAAWYFMFNKTSVSQNSSKSVNDTTNTQSAAVQKASQTATALVSSGNTTAAIKTLGDAASNTSSPVDKAQLYSQQAALYSQIGDNSNSISSAKQAIEANPTNWKGYANLGYIYRSVGDKNNAKDYFNQALAVMKQQSDETSAPEIKGAISQLEAS